MPTTHSRRAFIRAGVLTSAGIVLHPLLRRAPAVASPVPESDVVALLRQLVADMETRVPYAAALLVDRRSTSIGVDDQTKDIGGGSPNRGAVFTIHNGRWFQETATTDVTPDGLRAAAKTLLASARVTNVEVDVDPGPPLDATYETPCEVDPRPLGLAEHLDRTAALQSRLRALDDTIVNCSADYSQRESREIFVNRNRVLRQHVLRVRTSVSAYASDGGRTASNFDRKGGTGGLELTAFSDAELEQIVRDARTLVTATPVTPGSFRVVVDGTVAGTLAHESFGHGVEMDMFVKDRALAESYLNERVGSDRVNILDDPSMEGAYGGYYFDHEGELSTPTHIVRDGVFERGLTDLMSATALHVPRTANGRRQDAGRKAYARMSNTFFAPGTDTVEALIGDVSHGLLLQKFTHGMEDPKGWGILVSAHIGREIQDGKLTGKIYSPVGITGYVPDVLASVDGVANDFTTVPATCGKGHKEYVAVSTGGPHIRFEARLS